MATIRYETSDCEIDFEDGTDVNLLRLSIRYDGGLPWKCATGLCGTDRILIVEGAEHISAPRRRERDRLGDLLDDGVRLACQTYATGSVTVVWDKDQQSIDEDSAAGKRLKARWLSDGDVGTDSDSDGDSDSDSDGDGDCDGETA